MKMGLRKWFCVEVFVEGFFHYKVKVGWGRRRFSYYKAKMRSVIG